AEANGTAVQVEARISAWYSSPDSGRSEYRSLPSNGRLEADLLARLGDVLAPPKVTRQVLAPPNFADNAAVLNSSNPRPASAKSGAPLGKSHTTAATQEQLDAILAERQSVQTKTASVLAQIQALKNTDQHPGDGLKLASVKRSGVGVMSRMS